MTQSDFASSATPATFSSLGLVPELVQTLTELNYVVPTPIQSQAIPSILSGRSLLGQAKTGSGKTAAFALPLLQRLAKTNTRQAKGNQAASLILVPTRELAAQVATNIKDYARLLQPKLKIESVYGGVSVNTQMLALRGGADVVVATPGRLLDLVSSNAIKLNQIETLVLDEADRMLSLGFSDELAKILALLPKQKQVLLFSATFPEEVKQLADHLLDDPVVLLSKQEQNNPLTQRVITVNKDRKTALLIELIRKNGWRQLLIFASAKRTCNRLAQKLTQAGIAADIFHSDKGQGARQRILQSFKQGELQVLIATDLAARGIDIEKLPVVINYELPRSPSDYMHRIGRSARAGHSGLALSLISHDEYQHFKLIEKKNKLRLQREQIAGFEADPQAPLDCPSRKPKAMAKPAGSGKKKRKSGALVNQDIWQTSN